MPGHGNRKRIDPGLQTPATVQQPAAGVQRQSTATWSDSSDRMTAKAPCLHEWPIATNLQIVRIEVVNPGQRTLGLL